MFIIISALFVLTLVSQLFFLGRFSDRLRRKSDALRLRHDELNREAQAINDKADALEREIGEYFIFYELAKKLAAITNRKDLFSVFIDEIRYFGKAEKLETSRPPDSAAAAPEEGVFALETGKDPSETIYIKTTSQKIITYAPRYRELLHLCVEKITLYEKLQQLAIYDFLTEVYNRRYFDLRFGEEFGRAEKYNLNLSFLMIDIDDFKRVNDTYGHLVGDVILKETAGLIRETIREIDFLARFGGEEFTAVLLDTDKIGAISVAERICAKISGKKIKAFDEILNVTVSVGVANFPQNTIHDDILMETADKALYKAKAAGKNRVGYF